MFKLNSEKLTEDKKRMKDMKPCEIAIIIEGDYSEEIVMRTASTNKNEVMSLSNPGIDKCWTWKTGDSGGNLEVIPLVKGTKLTLEVV